jgi:hypothetical protein
MFGVLLAVAGSELVEIERIPEPLLDGALAVSPAPTRALELAALGLSSFPPEAPQHGRSGYRV